jgi:hypothetical protein
VRCKLYSSGNYDLPASSIRPKQLYAAIHARHRRKALVGFFIWQRIDTPVSSSEDMEGLGTQSLKFPCPLLRNIGTV